MIIYVIVLVLTLLPYQFTPLFSDPTLISNMRITVEIMMLIQYRLLVVANGFLKMDAVTLFTRQFRTLHGMQGIEFDQTGAAISSRQSKLACSDKSV